MAQEIERKWLLAQLPAKSHLIHAEDIQQGYLLGEPIQPRLRESIFNGVTTYYLTMKSKGDGAREELETKIREELFFVAWAQTEGCSLSKTRYHDPIKGTQYIAEIDKYSGDLAGLFIVEVEFPTIEEKDAFIAPSWFKAVREVTDDPRFKNTNLARNGWSSDWLKE